MLDQPKVLLDKNMAHIPTDICAHKVNIIGWVWVLDLSKVLLDKNTAHVSTDICAHQTNIIGMSLKVGCAQSLTE